MINDIAPHRFSNIWKNDIIPQPDDYVVIFKDSDVLVKCAGEGDSFTLPCVFDIDNKITLKYLFMVDDKAYFTSLEISENVGEALKYVSVRAYRQAEHLIGFPIITASQLHRWYVGNRFCGKCASPMTDSKTERALVCSKCGRTIYPTISPAVTVAVIDNDERILLAKSAVGTFKKFALVAGYTEIGESFEDTVTREVAEEVGLKVKNIRYYKSQPWGVSSTEMVGFFAELDGSDEVTLQREELSEARWFTPEEIEEPDDISLTFEMIRMFKEGRVKEWKKDF